jgi:hypothetical protein
MNPSSGKRICQTFIVLLVALAVPSLLLAEHNSGRGASHSAPQHESHPASHESHPAPQHESHPAPSHNAPSHNAPSHNAPSHTSSRPATTGHSTTPSHTTTPSRSTGMSNRGTTNRPNAMTGHTTTPNRGATTGRSSTPARGNAMGGRAGANARPAAATRGNVGSHTPPGRTVSLRGGGTASIRPNGQIRSINRNGMQISRGIHGNRTVVSERNGARIVTVGHGGGYVQRAYVTRGGVSYVSRTYYVHGAYHVGVYRSYYWGGHPYYGWRPGFYWHPGFYAWGWHPWGAPLYWGVGLWGWGGAPWWGYYSGWWNPYPYYAGPAYWLTDYLIASQLQAAYQARQDAQADAMAADAQAGTDQGDGDGGGGGPAPAASSGVTLTPEVKEAIAAEVKAQLQAQAAQAPGGDASGGGSAPAPAPASANGQVPPALDPAQRTFVVDSDLTVVSNGQECGLTAGDVLTRLTDAPDSDQTVSASVSASKKADCGAGQTVAVKVDDLQEMYNHFQEQLNNGMSEMAKKQGTNGMPKAPDTGTTPSDVPPPQPDTSAAQTLQQQQQQADQTEAQVKQEAASSGGGQ